MKTFTHSLFVAVLVLVSASQTSATNLFGKVTVVIESDIPIEYSSAHCWTSDYDVGVYILGEGQRLKFTFHRFLLTKYYCDFTTPHGSGVYGVFTNRLDKMCNGNCVWHLRKSGPCMEKTNGELYCQEWKIPGKLPPPVPGVRLARSPAYRNYP